MRQRNKNVSLPWTIFYILLKQSRSLTDSSIALSILVSNCVSSMRYVTIHDVLHVYHILPELIFINTFNIHTHAISKPRGFEISRYLSITQFILYWNRVSVWLHQTIEKWLIRASPINWVTKFIIRGMIIVKNWTYVFNCLVGIMIILNRGLRV